MFTTVEGVKELTGYDVDLTTVSMAQSIIEVYIGKIEADIYDPTDSSLLASATAYQAAYMSKNKELVFEQMSTVQVMQFGQMITFGPGGTAPFIAPLAVLATKNLSWHRNRSIKTGSIFQQPTRDSTWRTD